mmetsp:Transcript_35197/g.49248  ORF Transcript_35197/g.49248 Transcript_35197/m.49248 type:complete len:215 (+) Transcript_35197:218-862(+)
MPCSLVFLLFCHLLLEACESALRHVLLCLLQFAIHEPQLSFASTLDFLLNLLKIFRSFFDRSLGGNYSVFRCLFRCFRLFCISFCFLTCLHCFARNPCSLLCCFLTLLHDCSLSDFSLLKRERIFSKKLLEHVGRFVALHHTEGHVLRFFFQVFFLRSKFFLFSFESILCSSLLTLDLSELSFNLFGLILCLHRTEPGVLCSFCCLRCFNCSLL